MTTLTRAELETEKLKLNNRLVELKDSIGADKEDYTPEERAEIDKAFERIGDIRRSLEIINGQDEARSTDQRDSLERLFKQSKSNPDKLSEVQQTQLRYHQAWYDYILNGATEMNSENRSVLEKGPTRSPLSLQKHALWTAHAERALDNWEKYTRAVPEIEWGKNKPEERAQATTPGSAGGFLIPQGFSNELERQMKYFGGMRAVSRIYPTQTGNTVDWPTVDDTGNVATIVGEGAAIPEQDLVFAQKQLKAFKYVSGYVYVSWELLQDSFFNFESLLAEMFAQRFGRGTNLHFTTGNGTTQPEGIQDAINTVTLATGGALSYDDVINLKYAVDKAYRDMPGSRFMFSDTIEKTLMLIKETTGLPIWQPSIREGTPDRLLGVPYEINNDMATDLTVGAAKKPVAMFGDFSKYIIRDVAPVTMMRLNELRALNGQVVFLAWSRHDGRFVSAVDSSGSTPVFGLKPAAA